MLLQFILKCEDRERVGYVGELAISPSASRNDRRATNIILYLACEKKNFSHPMDFFSTNRKVGSRFFLSFFLSPPDNNVEAPKW